MDKLEKITLKIDDEDIDLYILEQTRIGGINYLLATEEETGDGEAYILKDLSKDGEEESILEFVEDDAEFDAVAGVFASMLDDVDFE